MAAAAILNGERVVVVLFIGLVLFSLPLSLLLHGVALSLLALSALFIEIRAEDDASSSSSLSLFETRYSTNTFHNFRILLLSCLVPEKP